MELPEYVRNNRDHWNRDAANWVAAGERHWAGEAAWGMWEIPEAELNVLPGDMTNMRTIELGCGTGYVSGWMVSRGAIATGIDVSTEQLATARRLADQHGAALELIEGNAEQVPRAGATFDMAISEYGAAIWADPYVWIPEAWRLLKPDGQLIFLGSHPLAMITQDWATENPVSRQLHEPYFGMRRFDWNYDGDAGTEFNLPISDWIQLFNDTGFEILEYHELQAPEPSSEVRFFASAEWSHDYPSEQLWKLRKR